MPESTIGLFFPRILDVLLLGPLKIILGSYTKNKILKYLLIVIGLWTMIYNWANRSILHFNISPVWLAYVPGWIRDLFFHPIHGKTQLVRIINLLVMYPILIMAYKSIQENKDNPEWINHLNSIFALTIMGGIVFNGFNYMKLQ